MYGDFFRASNSCFYFRLPSKLGSACKGKNLLRNYPKNMIIGANSLLRLDPSVSAQSSRETNIKF